MRIKHTRNNSWNSSLVSYFWLCALDICITTKNLAQSFEGGILGEHHAYTRLRNVYHFTFNSPKGFLRCNFRQNPTIAEHPMRKEVSNNGSAAHLPSVSLREMPIYGFLYTQLKYKIKNVLALLCVDYSTIMLSKRKEKKKVKWWSLITFQLNTGAIRSVYPIQCFDKVIFACSLFTNLHWFQVDFKWKLFELTEKR